MKALKFTVLGLLVLAVALLGGGYLYFDRKFTPPENTLSVSGVAAHIPIRWIADEGNPHAALLLPVKLDGIDRVFYMQLDTGAPSTVFYGNSLRSILARYPAAFAVAADGKRVGLGFSMGRLGIRSRQFELLDYGSKVAFDGADAADIIGTIGTDLLEKRIAVLDFKRDFGAFLEQVPETGFSDFQFKKRRVLLPARIGNEERVFLYDSGSSGYQLLTGKQEWLHLRTPSGPLKVEQGNSWGRPLKVVTAPANRAVTIAASRLPLTEVTHVEGTSKMQEWLMRSSGMQGMVGNTLFLDRRLTLDARKQKFRLE